MVQDCIAAPHAAMHGSCCAHWLTACMQGRQQDLGGAAGLATKHRQASAWGSCLWDCHVGHVGAWLRCSQYGMEWHGMAWRGMTWRGMTWHGMAGAVWMCPRSNNPPLQRFPPPSALSRLVQAMGAILPLLSHRKPGSRRGSMSDHDWEQVRQGGRSHAAMSVLASVVVCSTTLFSQLVTCATHPSSLLVQAFDRLDAQCKRMAFTLARATPEERQQQGIGELGGCKGISCEGILMGAGARHGFIAVREHVTLSHAMPALCRGTLHHEPTTVGMPAHRCCLQPPPPQRPTHAPAQLQAQPPHTAPKHWRTVDGQGTVARAHRAARGAARWKASAAGEPGCMPCNQHPTTAVQRHSASSVQLFGTTSCLAACVKERRTLHCSVGQCVTNAGQRQDIMIRCAAKRVYQGAGDILKPSRFSRVVGSVGPPAMCAGWAEAEATLGRLELRLARVVASLACLMRCTLFNGGRGRPKPAT